MKRFVILLLWGLCISINPLPTIAADIKLVGTELVIVGVIDDSTYNKVIRIYQHFPFNTLSITSGGGEFGAGMNLAQFVDDHGIPVYVPEFCHSACTFVFMMSPTPMMADGAIIGIHNISFTPADGHKGTDLVSINSSMKQAHAAAMSSGYMFSFYAAMGIPGNILIKASQMTGRDMYKLQKRDMIEFGIVKK